MLTEQGKKFSKALQAMAVRLADEEDMTDEESNSLIQSIWENWDETRAAWLDKHHGFDHEYEHVWLLYFPIGPEPIYMQVQKNKLPRNWLEG